MIPQHLIDKAARSLIRGRGRDPEDTSNLGELGGATHDAQAILEAVAADIWEQGHDAGYDWGLAVADTPNPYRKAGQC